MGSEAMRTRANGIGLIGVDRRVELTPGLNIVTGPITSGKTSFLRLCRAVFGGGLDGLPPEVREKVSAIRAEIVLGERRFSVVRPNVTTSTAKVEIAGEHEAARLPASQLDATARITYTQWLLEKLGLPRIEVPSAPTRIDSPLTPLSINDYFLYCDLDQSEIDNSVFGHTNYFKNVKRKYVFEVLYGLYDVETARLQDELREVHGRLRHLEGEEVAFERFLSETAWENRAALEESLQQARLSLLEAEAEAMATAQHAPSRTGATARLRGELAEVDQELEELRRRDEREAAAIDELSRLAAQLESQTERLTRAIVADVYLSDFEFVVCPRCGSSVSKARAGEGHCYVCLQVPSGRGSRETLIREQDRIGTQILETRELIAVREEARKAIAKRTEGARVRRRESAHELDVEMQSYVSDTASAIAEVAGRRGRVQAEIRRLEDYLTLFGKLDAARGDLEALRRRQEELQVALDVAGSRRVESEARIRRLEEKFEAVVEELGVPRFGSEGKATIDRVTYLPVLDGRRFDELSSQGLKVLVNVAHAVAHHEVAVELKLSLPGILIVDGLTSNVGHEGFDLERVRDVYGYLMRLASRLGDQLQLIVADNDVPEEASEYIRLRLTERERLIPV
jgi:AAA domain